MAKDLCVYVEGKIPPALDPAAVHTLIDVGHINQAIEAAVCLMLLQHGPIGSSDLVPLITYPLSAFYIHGKFCKINKQELTSLLSWKCDCSAYSGFKFPAKSMKLSYLFY